MIIIYDQKTLKYYIKLKKLNFYEPFERLIL